MLSQVLWTCIITWCLVLKSLNSESTSKVDNCRTLNDEVGSCVSTHKNVHLLPKDCGLTGIFERSILHVSEVPWIALLSYNTSNGTDFRCTGSVINNRYILTAAHCTTQNSKFKLIGVRCGEHNLDTEIDCEDELGFEICAPPVQDMEIEEIIPHPNYNPKTYTNDIALIRLATPLNTSQENVKPICLPVASSFKNHSGWLTVTGWRLIDSRSAVLLKTVMKIGSKDNCEKAYQRFRVQINDKQLCADQRIRISCVSDGGGPLQGNIYDGDVRTVQYGVLSFGPPHCKSIDFPFVYTKTESYLTWILDSLRP